MADEIKLENKSSKLTLLASFAAGAMTIAGIEQFSGAAPTAKLEYFSCHIRAGCEAMYYLYDGEKKIGEKAVYFGLDSLTGKPQSKGVKENKLPAEMKALLKAMTDRKLDALANE